jgi:rubrerythrin
MSTLTIAPALVRAARIFYTAEHVGGVFYRRFAARVRNRDVGDVFGRFATDEHDHAGWYAAWLAERGFAPPKIERVTTGLIEPALRSLLLPLPLQMKLQAFARVEALATRHLTELARRIPDPALRGIVEQTIPFERGHAEWFEREGRHMLTGADRAPR